MLRGISTFLLGASVFFVLVAKRERPNRFELKVKLAPSEFKQGEVGDWASIFGENMCSTVRERKNGDI